MFKNICSKKVPFIGWVEFQKPNNEPYGDFGVYLINPTGETYERIEVFTGMYAGDMDGLLESDKVIWDFGVLMPHSSIEIDEITWYDLDFVIWYHFDFYRKSGDEKPAHYYWFEIKKAYAWKEEKIELLPVLNRKGIKIDFRSRADNKTIPEEAREAHLKSRYIPSQE